MHDSQRDAADDRLARWQQLMHADYAPLRAAAMVCDPTSPAEIEALRSRWDAALVTLALSLADARQRAASKFPDHPDIIADPLGVQQATSGITALHKAARFRRAGFGKRDTIHDLCCGIGGDAMALALIAQVVAIDRDPVRAWMAACNADCTSRAGDVTDPDVLPLRDIRAFHIDPSRRDEASGRRTWRYADVQPPPAFIDALLAACPDGAIKLGPGADVHDLPRPDAARELEWISESGRLVQLVLWSGRLAEAPGMRTATLLPDDLHITALPAEPPLYADGAYLHEADPAIERADLLAALCATLQNETPAGKRSELGEMHPGLGLLTSDAPIKSPWITSYRIIDQMPWRPRRVKQHLRTLGAGLITVKLRGVQEDADMLQRWLRGTGDVPLTAFLTRLDQRRITLICERG